MKRRTQIEIDGEIYDEYICDDRPIPVSDRIKNMTEEEKAKEFQRLFGKYLKQLKKEKAKEFQKRFGKHLKKPQKEKAWRKKRSKK